MDWTLQFASNWRKTETVQIEALKDLEALYEKYGTELIVNFEDHNVIIYDDYVE